MKIDLKRRSDNMVSSTGLGQFARAVIPLERANSCSLTCAPAPPLRLPSLRNLQWTSQPDERRTHSPKNNNGPFTGQPFSLSKPADENILIYAHDGSHQRLSQIAGYCQGHLPDGPSYKGVGAGGEFCLLRT
jgi:hypothetical protein